MGHIFEEVVRGIVVFRKKVASDEERFLGRVLRRWSFPGAELLDVGCGYSKFYQVIHERGVRYIGVDVNPDIVEHNRALGRVVYTDVEFQPGAHRYDVLLLSHIIEHFHWRDLVSFLNKYLEGLRTGGTVVILTPVYHRGFYDDFDHVKPYNAKAIRQLFCRSSTQTQDFGLSGQYVELDMWFKRNSLWHTHRSGVWSHVIASAFSLACGLSGGLFGKLTGYGIVLRKVG